MNPKTKTYTDQMGREVEIPVYPQRIISLVPSQTEFLADLGLDKELIGITKFCIHPDHIFRTKNRIGGTKKIDFEKIKSLNPDLIIGNKEENQREQIEELMKYFPVWMSDIKSTDDAVEMMKMVGEICSKSKEAAIITTKIKEGFSDLNLNERKTISKAAYFIWRDPWMVAGSNNIIDHLLSKAGFKNIFSHHPGRYPKITFEEMRNEAPDFVLLSSEPFPFKEKHIQEIEEVLPKAKVILVDGEMFSWYGSRLLMSPQYFKNLDQEIQKS